MKTYIKLFLIIVFTINSKNIFAYPGGVSGYTLKSGTLGCGTCHSTHSSPNSAIMVQIIGPTTLQPNQKAQYQVQISGGTGSKVGVDISSSSGALSIFDANLKLLNSELTQTSAKSYSGGKYTFNFYYTAPSTAGSVTLYSTGMSNKTNWNFATNFSVNISAPQGINSPSNLTIVGMGTLIPYIKLDWTDNSTNETNFIIERRIGNKGAFSQIGQVPQNTTTYNDSAIIRGSIYSYRIYAKNNDTSSTYSNEANMYLPKLGITPPSGLTAIVLDSLNLKIRLTWSDNSENENGFIIERSLNNDSSFLKIDTVISGINSYTDSSANFSAIYTYRVYGFNSDTTSSYSNYANIQTPLTNISSELLPYTIELYQNYPNPFNPTTTLSYILDKESKVKLIIYDILGNIVNILIDGTKSAGVHRITWDGTDISGKKVTSGIYFYELTVENSSRTSHFLKKMTLIK